MVWTVSRLKSVNSKGKRFEIEYEGPHVLEAVSPVVICEPLEVCVSLWRFNPTHVHTQHMLRLACMAADCLPLALV